MNQHIFKSITCNDCLTTSCFIKKDCSEEYLSLISKKKETSFYRKNQYIAQEGSTMIGLFFIQTGKAKIISEGLDRKIQVVRLTKTGDIIGYRGYGKERYPISAIALEESIICLIDNYTMYDVFMNTPKLTYELMVYYSNELSNSETKIRNQAQMNVRDKVVDALLYYNSLFNDYNQYPFLIDLNRQDISALAGINHEQLSRVLSDLKKENIIILTKNEIFISNQDYLKKIVAPYQ
ncbi:MAG: Crp/Fnr family transcriptional regulator [Flavobacteriales bacterium CG_4_10_14_0_2_um_filter_32_8]|nr:MAG: Crp/Fnr family transcriptional regulator [Flavobacteriales bacterium CG_4_10_14_0_2_um_filter_32_8]PJB14199.1 MAG: Crp/Fnr family transcriptional regulator [Flavobacteriales bacterium CG_4_9_14_3_um_filter_32_8]